MMLNGLHISARLPWAVGMIAMTGKTDLLIEWIRDHLAEGGTPTLCSVYGCITITVESGNTDKESIRNIMDYLNQVPEYD